MAEISQRTGLITVSLGSGSAGDVIYLFIEDLCGENPDPPRHARAFGNLARLHRQIQEERIAALTAFRQASKEGQFPAAAETVSIDPAELEAFLAKLKAGAGLVPIPEVEVLGYKCRPIREYSLHCDIDMRYCCGNAPPPIKRDCANVRRTSP